MRPRGGLIGLAFLLLGGLLGSCGSNSQSAEAPAPPPVGHYEGSLRPAGQAELRAALDIRHPSPGHYEAELTVPTLGTLNFVADTIGFSHNQLHLTRPGRPTETLALTLDGDFWRGTFALDSLRAETLLVKRGPPTPSTYRVEEIPQNNGSAWLFAPADTRTPGPALALLPDAATAPTTALWADALAREGIIVLTLPAPDSTATATAISAQLAAALRLLRGTAGADTANVGIWAVGGQATAFATSLTAPNAPRPAFFISQNAEIAPAVRAAFRALKQRGLPVLGLYGGSAAGRNSAALRLALGGRRSTPVRVYVGTGADLLVPGGLNPHFGPGLPGEVVEWLQGR